MHWLWIYDALKRPWLRLVQRQKVADQGICGVTGNWFLEDQISMIIQQKRNLSSPKFQAFVSLWCHRFRNMQSSWNASPKPARSCAGKLSNWRTPLWDREKHSRKRCKKTKTIRLLLSQATHLTIWDLGYHNWSICLCFTNQSIYTYIYIYTVKRFDKPSKRFWSHLLQARVDWVPSRPIVFIWWVFVGFLKIFHQHGCEPKRISC